MKTTTAARVYLREEPLWVQRAKAGRLPAKVVGGRAR